MTGASTPELQALGTREQALEDWLHQQAAPAYATYRANPSRGLSFEQVLASVGKRQQALMNCH